MSALLPPWFKPAAVVLGALSLVPFGVIARARNVTTTSPRIHIIRDMDSQEKFKAQAESALFADGRAMRPPVPGTVARGELMDDDHLERGLDPDGKFAATLPAALGLADDAKLAALLERGRERYGIHCAPCHGLSGWGDGMIHQRALLLTEKRPPEDGMQWVPPTNYHSDALRAYPVGRLFHVATHGIRNMAGYGAQMSTRDRWAVAAYVKALQHSQHPEMQ